MLSFDDDSSGALQKACYNSDASAKVVRREMFKQKYLFDVSLTEKYCSTVIVSFCYHYSKGPSIEHQSHLINTAV